jgi:hypothetical protein
MAPFAMHNRSRPTAAKWTKLERHLWTLVASVGCLAAGLAVAWWLGYFGKDPQLKEVEALQAEVAKSPPPRPGDKAAFARMEEIRTKTMELPEGLRQTAENEGRQAFMSNMIRHEKEVMALPPAERMAALDQEIDRIREMTQRMAMPGLGGGAGTNSPPLGPGGPGGSGGSGGSGPGGGPPLGRPPDPDSPAGKQFFNSMLSTVSAEDRATMGQWMQILTVRARQRGVALGGPFGN